MEEEKPIWDDFVPGDSDEYPELDALSDQYYFNSFNTFQFLSKPFNAESEVEND